MDEDNENGLKEPEIVLPIKEIDLETKAAINKQLEKNKMKETAQVEPEEVIEPITMPKEKTSQEKINEAAEIKKSQYQEMTEKIENERREREIRLEEQKTQEEDKNPNAKGSILKDIAIIIVVLGLIIGVGLMIAGNTSLALIVVLGGSILCAITMGLSEIIRLLQLIYDLLYFERYGKKRK